MRSVTETELNDIGTSWTPRDTNEDTWGSDTTTIRQLVAALREAWAERDKALATAARRLELSNIERDTERATAARYHELLRLVGKPTEIHYDQDHSEWLSVSCPVCNASWREGNVEDHETGCRWGEIAAAQLLCVKETAP